MAWYAYCIAEQQAFQGDSRARRPFPIENLNGLQGAQVMGYPSGERSEEHTSELQSHSEI